MISISSSGSFDNTERFLQAMQKPDILVRIAEAEAQKGVAALSAATPKDSGLASSSWSYEITRSGKGITISWLNTDRESGFPVAIMLQYGYATGTGGYVQGTDYINPAMRPVFDQIADALWKAVTSA